MIKVFYISVVFLLWSSTGFSQTTTQMLDTGMAMNSASRMITNASKKRVTIGAYAQIDYNQQFGDSLSHNGKLDVHRLVLLFAYKFSKRVSFMTEIEFEHVNEIFVEQAFLNYYVNDAVNIRGGLMLVPMGIINEYHEPPTFNGVERPNIDKYIVPTTWREIGLGITGKFNSISLRYQVYMFNGFLGYKEDGARFRGTDGYRKGRQKGIESVLTTPNFSAKLDYYGVLGLKLGLAGYYGKSQSTMFKGIDRNDEILKGQADSSVITISMVGFDARYLYKGFTTRGQVIYAHNQNIEAYDKFGDTDLGTDLFGYYIEAGFDFLSLLKNPGDKKLTLFARYEVYNTHQRVYDASILKKIYNRTDITAGLTFQIAVGAVVKVDYQRMLNQQEGNDGLHMFNAGLGLWF